MTEDEKIDHLIEKVSRLEFQVGRLASDYESEKDTRRRRNEGIDGVLYGRDGLITRVDRLEQYTSDLKQDRRERRGLWVSVLILFISAIMNWLRQLLEHGD